MNFYLFIIIIIIIIIIIVIIILIMIIIITIIIIIIVIIIITIIIVITIRPKKINNMFLRHRPRHLQPPASEIFIAFPVFTLKNCLYIANVSLGRPSFAAILFVDWLVRILKVKNLQEITRIHRFIVFHSKK